jgi:hypothetical protein
MGCFKDVARSTRGAPRPLGAVCEQAVRTTQAETASAPAAEQRHGRGGHRRTGSEIEENEGFSHARHRSGASPPGGPPQPPQPHGPRRHRVRRPGLHRPGVTRPRTDTGARSAERAAGQGVAHAAWRPKRGSPRQPIDHDTLRGAPGRGAAVRATGRQASISGRRNVPWVGAASAALLLEAARISVSIPTTSRRAVRVRVGQMPAYGRSPEPEHTGVALQRTANPARLAE